MHDQTSDLFYVSRDSPAVAMSTNQMSVATYRITAQQVVKPPRTTTPTTSELPGTQFRLCSLPFAGPSPVSSRRNSRVPRRRLRLKRRVGSSPRKALPIQEEDSVGAGDLQRQGTVRHKRSALDGATDSPAVHGGGRRSQGG